MQKDLFVSSLLDVYGKFLNDRQRIIAEYYYNDDLSLAEISEIENITRQGVMDYIKRAKTYLYYLEDNCGYCKKFLKLKELSENVSSTDKNILEILKIIDEL